MRLNVVHQGSGPPIVFIHGMGTSAASWKAVTDLLAERFHTVAIDLLGHGDSPVPDDRSLYSRDGALDDIDDVLAELDGSAILVGHSLGGYLALAHIATRPGVARGVVALNTGPGFRDPEKREDWNERSRRNAHRFGVPEHVADLNLQHDSAVMDRLAEIETPTLVLAGGDDRPEYQGSGQYLERKMAKGAFRLVEGGGHSMHEETHAAEVADIIAEFADSL